MEIVGVFHINFEQEVIPDRTWETDILANTFFCTPDIEEWESYAYQVQYGMDITAPESDHRLFNMVLFVEDPSLLDSVKERLLAIDSVDWSYYNMETYDKDYQTAAAPLLSMIKICNLLAVIPAIGILAVLFLVLMIWMRSRRYEVRILTLIGVKKNAVLSQFLMECCSIATAAFLAAFLLAGPVTKLVGDGLQTLFYASGNEEAYEVVTSLEVTKMDINLLPPEKEDALPFTVTFIEAWAVCLFLEGTAALSVIVSSAKMLKRI